MKTNKPGKKATKPIWANAEKFVNVPFPLWMVKAMDEEAKRLGINRQALIKVWIADRIEQVRDRKAASNS